MNDSDRTIMTRLRQETSDLHSHAESRTLQRQIAKGEVERSTFAAYLGQLYLVHSALERALEGARGSHPAIAALATADRMRVPDLERDLDFYGVEPDDVSAADATRRFLSLIDAAGSSDPSALLGAFYVLEGSTNGGRFLARTLRERWGIDDAGVAYLDPYGERQQDTWAAFKREMDAAEFEPEREDAIVDMARRTFEAIAEVSDEVAGAS